MEHQLLCKIFHVGGGNFTPWVHVSIFDWDMTMNTTDKAKGIRHGRGLHLSMN